MVTTKRKRYRDVIDLPPPTPKRPVRVEIEDIPAYLQIHSLAILEVTWQPGEDLPSAHVIQVSR